MLKISLLFKKFTNFTGKYLQNCFDLECEISRYCFCMNTNIQGDFQICISVLLTFICYVMCRDLRIDCTKVIKLINIKSKYTRIISKNYQLYIQSALKGLIFNVPYLLQCLFCQKKDCSEKPKVTPTCLRRISLLKN